MALFVAEDPSFDGHYQVRRGGYIIVPAVGRILVAWKTLPSAEDKVSKALEATQFPSAAVTLEMIEGTNMNSPLEIASGYPNIVNVTGRVARPCVEKISGAVKSLGAYAAILTAGGFAPFADWRNVYVSRRLPKGTVARIPIDVESISHGRTADVPLVGGDIVVVPEKLYDDSRTEVSRLPASEGYPRLSIGV